MHTYRKAKNEQLWTVGCWLNEDDNWAWEPMKDFGSEKEAAAYVNYLNGGDGKVLN